MSLFLKRTAVVFLSFALTFLAFEGLYRIYKLHTYGFMDYPDVISLGYYRPDPVYGLAAIPNLQGDRLPAKMRRRPELARSFSASFRSNSWGYRGREFSFHKPAGTYRIVALGGSTTIGMEVADDETWPARLEAMLNEDPAFLQAHQAQRVEVINAGNGGWRSREVLIRVREEVLKLQPDLLLLALSWNDACKGTHGDDPERAMFSPKPWWSYSALLQNLRIRFLNLQDSSKGYREAVMSRLRPDARWADLFRKNTAAIQAAAAEQGTAVALVDLPGLCRRTGSSGEEYREVVDRTRVNDANYLFWVELKELDTAIAKEMGKKLQVPVIGVSSDFEVFSGADRANLFTDEMHLTPEGADQVARSVKKGLQAAP